MEPSITILLGPQFAGPFRKAAERLQKEAQYEEKAWAQCLRYECDLCRDRTLTVDTILEKIYEYINKNSSILNNDITFKDAINASGTERLAKTGEFLKNYSQE